VRTFGADAVCTGTEHQDEGVQNHTRSDPSLHEFESITQGRFSMLQHLRLRHFTDSVDGEINSSLIGDYWLIVMQ
jgi:hypothetical protein